jgi:twinkle protein
MRFWPPVFTVTFRELGLTMALNNEAMDWLTDRGLDAELADRMGLSSERRAGGDCVVLPFLRKGQVVRRKFRAMAPSESTPKWTAEKGGQRIAFNEDCLRDDTLIGQPLLITEGEFDAIAAIQAGFARTISARSKEDLSAGLKYSWLTEIASLITKDRCPEGIIIASDGDENGAAMLQDLSVLLGRARCKFLTYPKRADGQGRCKDLNEVLTAYGSKGVVETVSRASWLKVDGVYLMSDLPPPPPMAVYNIRHELLSEHFKVRMGDFSVFTGTPGFGKTSVVTDIFNGVAHDNGLKIGWASFEQEPKRDHRRALRSWIAKAPEHKLNDDQLERADAWIDKHHVFLVPGEDEDATFEWLVEKMEVACVRHDVRIIVIDPWNEIEHSRRRDESETEYIGRAIRTLKRFAKAFQVHVCVASSSTA